MTGARALLRLAWRDARRDRWRTVLIVVLVTLPVALLGGAITSFDTMSALPEERAADEVGRADALVRPGHTVLDEDAPAPPELRARLADQLPDGTRIDLSADLDDHAVLPGERIPTLVTDRPIEGDHLGVGRYRLHAGRAPGADGEAALSEALAERFDLSIGDSLTLEEVGDVEVVGIARRPEFLLEEMVLLAPGALTSADAAVDPSLVVASLALFVEVPAGADAARSPGGALEALMIFPDEGLPEWYVSTREEILSYRFGEGDRWAAVIIGGLAVVEVALIVGAAFAVSVRRRQRELGLLAAVGATARHVRRTVLLTGAVAGGLGAVIGTALGLVFTLSASPWFQALTHREITTLRLDPLWLLGVAIVGVGSTLLGAWWPARAVARLPVTVALSGRRPAPQPAARGLRVGLVLVAAAVALLALLVVNRADSPFLFLAGSVLLVLGVGMTSPWLLEKAGRIAPRLPVGPRLAVRDAARFRTRNGPIVTAAMAGLAGSIAVATVVTSLDRHEARSYEPLLGVDQVVIQGDEGPGIARRVEAEFGGQAATIRLVDVGARPPGAAHDGSNDLFGWATVGDPVLAEVLGGQEAVAALERGEVAVFGDQADGLDEVEVFRWEMDEVSGTSDEGPPQTTLATLPIRTLPLPEGVRSGSGMLPTILLPASLGDEVTEFGTTGIVRLPSAVDDATHERIVAMAADASGDVYVQTERGYRSPYATALIVVLVAGAVTGLALVGIAIALAAAEARSDLRTLTAVGADRRTRRSLAAGRALLLSGIGGILAIPVGLVPGAAVLFRMSYVPLTVPWAAIVVASVAVPLLATLGAVIASRRDPGPSLRLVA